MLKTFGIFDRRNKIPYLWGNIKISILRVFLAVKHLKLSIDLAFTSWILIVYRLVKRVLMSFKLYNKWHSFALQKYSINLWMC